jgi:hypothetical protein
MLASVLEAKLPTLLDIERSISLQPKKEKRKRRIYQ